MRSTPERPARLTSWRRCRGNVMLGAVTAQNFVIVDAFVTGAPFTGNPAAVLVLADQRLEETWLQGLANELHQAETAYVYPRSDGSFGLRWFTPTTEVALCGHATLAAAHHLWESGRLGPDSAAVFCTLSGTLRATRAAGGIIELDFPAVPAIAAQPPPGLAPALNDTPLRWFGQTASDGTRAGNMLVECAEESAVRCLAPAFDAIAALPAGGLIVTAPGDGGDVVSRYFAPAAGILEDSVTGSAHCTLAPHWRQRMGESFFARQLSPRGGQLRVRMREDRVVLGGHAVTVLEGRLRT